MELLTRWTPSAGEAARSGFSLFELVMVITIMGVIAAIAVPRASQAMERSRDSAIKANLRVLTHAVDLYAAEHGDRTPAHNPDRSVTTNGAAFVARLTQNTDERGTPEAGGLYGPYLLRAPANPNSKLATIRVDGPAAGVNTHGWRFDTQTREFQADDSARSAALKLKTGLSESAVEVAAASGGAGGAALGGGTTAVFSAGGAD